MASYQSSFDPPNRPEFSSRRKRLGTFIPPPSSHSQDVKTGRLGYREADIASISGQTDSRPTFVPSQSRQTNIPVPNVRGIPLATNSAAKPKSTSTFGLRRQAAPSPSTVLGSQTLQKKHSRNVLRRKPSSIAQHTATPPSQLVCAEEDSRTQEALPMPDESFARPAQSSFGSTRFLDKREPTLPNVEIPPQIIPELDRYRAVGNHQGLVQNRFVTDIPHKLATHDLPPPTPLSSGMSGHSRHSGFSGNSGYSGYSASPSTRFSESPGPGAYSRDTTPTSMSSQSPGIVAPLRMTPRLRQVSPINSRPPVSSSRRRAGSTPNEAESGIVDAQGLPSLRESLTSSSSNSTVKGGDKEDRKKKKKRLSPLPPSPPPRKSSQKFKKPHSEEEETSPSKTSRAPARPVMTSPLEKSPSKLRSNLASPSDSKAAPPPRPSRDGTPDLQSQLEESMTVIQSNLSGLHLSPDRRQSVGFLPRSAVQTAGKNVDASPSSANVSRLPSRGFSPIPVQVQREATPAPSGLGIIPDLRPAMPQKSSQRSVTGSRTPSPSTTAPKHRFGLFGRRTKTTPEVTTVSQGEKSARKGPAAGTGHEGYGRYALRSRSNSIPGNRDRSHSAASSQESLTSSRTHDPFLLERMNPVIIAGGGEIRNESLDLTRSESSQSLPYTRPSIESKTSTHSNLSKEVSRTTLWPSAMPRNHAANDSSTSLASKGTFQSESSDNDGSAKKPTLAFRRSMNRLLSTDQEPLQLPKTIMISSDHPSPGLSSQGTSLISDENQTIERGNGKGSTSRKLSKRPRSPRKWNFFQRTQTASPKPQPEAVTVVITTDRLPLRPVPYYAMMDSSEQEGDDAMDMEDILREAEVVDLSRVHLNSPESKTQDSTFKSKIPEFQVATHNIPSPSETNVAAIQYSPRFFSSPELLATENTQVAAEIIVHGGPPIRPSRLAQVGRIPKVVTARPQQTSPKSFSRPFARVSMIQPLPKLNTVDHQSIAVGPSPERSPSPFHRLADVSTESGFSAVGLDNRIVASQQTTKDEFDVAQSNGQERAFFVISPRKNSEATTSSSSGAISTTAVIPEPDAALEEDEVWDEYDDLIGDDDNIKVPPSATSSHGVPFQYEGFESRAMRRANSRKKESPIVDVANTFIKNNGPHKPLRLELAPPSLYSPEFSSGFKNVFKKVPSPSTPMSFTDFFSGYGDRNNSVITGSGGTRRIESPHSQRDSLPASIHSKSASVCETSRQSANAKLVTISDQAQESPIAQVNLRVGSLTVSKWLTFGHVLFSPAREEIIRSEDQGRHHSVLVVDGLGNDDFSYYACETHPMATFYNLSPTAAINGVPSALSPSIQPPNNHRQVQYTNNLEKFPFPRDNFSAVVLRFPSACSEAAFRNLITESRRVLKPAGYLELSIMDLDMNTMGNRTRRAVRGLKVNVSVADPSISLASASDTALRLIGKRAFHDIKSCKVGIPVASTVTAKSGSGSYSGSEDKSDDNDISLADMMKDETSVGDDGIAKMVAKVGRFWFLRCYERAVLPNGDVSRSIFSDAAVLRECEKWNTSFKLLVCYAQKPAVPRRRTASV